MVAEVQSPAPTHWERTKARKDGVVGLDIDPLTIRSKRARDPKLSGGKDLVHRKQVREVTPDKEIEGVNKIDRRDTALISSTRLTSLGINPDLSERGWR